MMNKYYILEDSQFTVWTEGNISGITGTKQGYVLNQVKAKSRLEELQAKHIPLDEDMFVCMDLNPLDVPSEIGSVSGYFTEIPVTEESRTWVTQNSGSWCLVDGTTRQVKEVSEFNKEYYELD
ncbi:MAG: hypothetical protein ACRCW9_05850 [Cetobacterium sp.]